MAIDPDALAASLRRLATLGEPGASVVEGLRHVTEACVDLFGVAGSGIMLADEQNIPRYVAASDGPGRMLEVAESETGQGPCTEAFVNNAVVASTDVTAEPRWPDLATALRPHGVRAVLGLPVRLGAVTVGTLDVFYDRPHVWQDDECQALGRYRDVVESTLVRRRSSPKCRGAGRPAAVCVGLSGDHRARCRLLDGSRWVGFDDRLQPAPPGCPRHPEQDRRRGATAGVHRTAADRGL